MKTAACGTTPYPSVLQKLPCRRRRNGIQPLALAIGVALWCSWPAWADPTAPVSDPSTRAVSALGRIEPAQGILTLSASSIPEAISGALVTQLLVEVGDEVVAGQLLAVTDAAAVLEARVAEVRGALVVASHQAEASQASSAAFCVRAGVAQREAERLVELRAQNLASEDEIDRARGNAEAGAADCTAAGAETLVATSQIELEQARLTRAEAELARSLIRAPVSGTILAINARPGELIGLRGILDMGQLDKMYAIAEVYETDVGFLRVGQPATVSSPALAEPLTGSIERIRPLVRKMDEIGTDPAARKDARIVEVEVLLDSAAPAAMLTNLQVDIVFSR